MNNTTPPNLRGLDLDSLLATGLDAAPPQPAAAWEPPPVEDLKGVLPGYEMVRLIGRGGMGAVYEARQVHLGRRVAVKILPAELSANEAFAERFRREARTLGSLEHSNILEVFDFGESAAGHLFYSMPYIEGGDLSALLKNGPVAQGEALRMVKEICAALEAAHAQGVIHRDIKPSNILLTSEGTVKVADFGIAVLEDQPRERLTYTGVAVGTLEYAAPEQAEGTGADPRSDLYSVGVICYEILTGRLPRGIFDPPSKVNAGVSPSVDPVIQTAMQNDPARRFQSATEFRAALNRTGPARTKKSRRGRIAAVVFAGAIIAAGAALFQWQPWKSKAHADAQTDAPAPQQPARANIPGELELRAGFDALANGDPTAEEVRKWAKQFKAIRPNLPEDRQSRAGFFREWMERVDARRAAMSDDIRWAQALAIIAVNQAHTIEPHDPKGCVVAFLRAYDISRAVHARVPDDSYARWALAENTVKALDSVSHHAGPAENLAFCKEAVATRAALGMDRGGEEWFDQYIGTSFLNALKAARSANPSLAPQVKEVATKMLGALFPNRESLSAADEGIREELRHLTN